MKRAWPAIAWAAALFGLSSIPGDDLTMVPDVPHLDKGAHMALYTVLAALVARALAARRSLGAWTVALAALAIAAAYGASDEWHQSFVPGRSCSFWDWLSDGIGSILGIALWAIVGTVRRLRRPSTGIRPTSEGLT